MPLTEIPATDIRRNASLTQPPSRYTSELEAAPISGKRSMEETAIQSMLRVNTETGDIGRFSVRASRIPRPGSRRPRRKSGSFDSTLTTRSQSRPPTVRSIEHQPYKYTRSRPSFSGLSRQDTVASSQTSHHNRRRPRVRGQRSLGLEGLASPPPVLSHGFQSHRSLVTLRSQTDGASHGSQSPFPYPARLRRPSYRAASPAFSDAQYAPYSSGSADPRAGSVGPMSSPMFPPSTRPQFHRTDKNRSVSSLQRFPSPSISNGHYPSSKSPYPSTSATPVSYRIPSPALPIQNWNGIHGLQRSDTSSTTPIFFDYSESYTPDTEQNPRPDTSKASLSFTPKPYIAEYETTPRIRNAQTPFGILPGSIFSPSELPAVSHSNSGQLSHRRAMSQASSHRSSAVASRKTRGHGRSVSQVSKPPPVLTLVDIYTLFRAWQLDPRIIFFPASRSQN